MRLWLMVKIKSAFRTQRAFAIACGKSDDWASKLVNGISNPSEDEKKLIASKLKTDYCEELFLDQKRPDQE